MKKINYLMIILILTLLIGILYLSQPVPYCKDLPKEEIIENTNTTYSEWELEEAVFQISSGTIIVKTGGDSMFPTIKNGQGCFCVQKERYIIGDIVAFFYDKNGEYQGILHRIISEDGEDIITKGDNNEISDPSPIKQENILCAVPEVKMWETLF
jgi:hypothetical protein